MFSKAKTFRHQQRRCRAATQRMPVPAAHFVNGHPLEPPFPDGLERAMFGMGCFWGAEKKFWQLPGVYTTAVGYAAGITPNPTYREVCTGMTGHAEVVLVVFDPNVISLRRSAEGVLGEPRSDAGDASGQRRRHAVPLGHLLLRRRRSSEAAEALARRVPGSSWPAPATAPSRPRSCRRRSSTTPRTTTSSTSRRIPNGYCGLGGTGVSCPVGVAAHAVASRRYCFGHRRHREPQERSPFG